MSLDDDLALDGEPEREYVAGIAARLPRKRVAAGALIRDADGRVVLVVPNYKPGLDLPGGIVEEGESPYDAAVREVAEELGVAVPIGALLVVDWLPAQGVWGDGLAFVFDGGRFEVPLGPDAVARRDPEIADVLVLDPVEAAARMRPSMARRIAQAIRVADGSGPALFLQFGRPVGPAGRL